MIAGNLEIRHDCFTEVVGSRVEVETVASGFEFLEGPAWHPSYQFLVFSDLLGNCMYRWSQSEGITLFRKPSNMANGNTYDREVRLLTCEHATSRVTRAEHNGNSVILASHYNGKELNSPNDIVVKHDGTIYFTDPNSGRGPKYGIERPQELPFQGIFKLDPNNTSLILVAEDFSKPNGLCFSLDEKQIFINDTDRNHIRVFDINADGTLANGRVWAEIRGTGLGVPDGMKIDKEGHLYCCGPGGIHVFDRNGNALGVILLPEQTANLAWGDEDLCSLYVTAATVLFRIRLNIPGLI